MYELRKSDISQQHLDPALAPTFALFDRMRRKRNDAFYDITIITATEAEEAVATAENYLRLVANDVTARLK